MVGKQLLVLLYWVGGGPRQTSTYAPRITRHPLRHQASGASLK